MKIALFGAGGMIGRLLEPRRADCAWRAHRQGTDRVVTDAQGESRISVEDHTAAMIDELERSSTSGSGSPWRIDAAVLRAEDH